MKWWQTEWHFVDLATVLWVCSDPDVRTSARGSIFPAGQSLVVWSQSQYPLAVVSSLFLPLLLSLPLSVLFLSPSLHFTPFLSLELGIESGASHMLDKCVPTEPQPSQQRCQWRTHLHVAALLLWKCYVPHQFRVLFYTESMFWPQCSEENFGLEETSN